MGNASRTKTVEAVLDYRRRVTELAKPRSATRNVAQQGGTWISIGPLTRLTRRGLFVGCTPPFVRQMRGNWAYSAIGPATMHGPAGSIRPSFIDWPKLRRSQELKALRLLSRLKPISTFVSHLTPCQTHQDDCSGLPD